MRTYPRERSAFIAACRRAFSLGMQVSSGGNISLRLRNDLFLVKPSGISLLDLKKEDLLVIDRSGKVVEGERKPTKELDTHLRIYRVRVDAGAVVHYHSPYATAYAVSDLEIPLKTLHARRILGKIPLLPVEEEGSEALASSVEKLFSYAGIHAALLSGHGMIAVGRDLDGAQNLAELVEESAKVAYLSASMTGRAPFFENGGRM